MQVKTTMRYPHTPVRIAKIKKITSTSQDGKNVEKLNHLHFAGRDGKLEQLFWKPVWQFLIKLNMQLPYNLVIASWALFPEK